MNFTKRRSLFIVLFMLIASAPISADEYIDLKDKILRISDTSTEKEKLELLDKLASELRPNDLKNKSPWFRETHKSAIDDSIITILSLNAVTPITAWPNKSYTPVLVLRTGEGKTDVFFDLGVTPNVESGNSRTITVRFDDKVAENIEGSLSTSNDSLFIQDVDKILRELYEAKVITIKFTPYNSSPVITKFELSDFKQQSVDFYKAANIDLSDKKSTFSYNFLQAIKREDLSYKMNISSEKNIVTLKTHGGGWKATFRNINWRKP